MMMCCGYIIAILCTILVSVAAAANTGTGDPRCPADFDPMQRCPSSMILPGGAGLDPSGNVDSTSCVDQENCPKCLDSPEWQTRLKDLVGLYTAKRDPTFKPWLTVGDWLSYEIVSTIAMILLRETMDIDARGAASNAFGNVEHICCSEPLVSFESWDSDTFLEDTQRTVAASPVGYTGQSGFFVPPYTVEKYPLAFTYQSYLLVDEYKHIFDRSFTTSCENMTADSPLGCVDGNYICGNNEWTNTTCYEGKRYVPPQCNIPGQVGNPNATNCQEVYLEDPVWEPGLLEGMIKNTGLNMTAAYLGGGRYGEFISDAFARKKDIMFYWWRPDPFVTLMDARQVQFDDATPECEEQYSSDPTLNTAKCGFPLLTLQKRTQTTTLAMDADFKHFFDTFTISDTLLNKLMGQHYNGGGNSTVYDISCDWIKGNMDTWSNYVQNSPTTTATATSTANLLSSPGVLAAVIIVPLIVAAAIVVVVVYLCLRHRASTRNAPITAPLAIIFTDIESSTMLWEAFGDEMGRAVEIHHAIIRNHIDEYGAYEVKTVGDSFMIACGSLADATLLCLAIQTSLGECTEFPKGLRYQQSNQLVPRNVSNLKIGSEGSRTVGQDIGLDNSQPTTSLLRYPLRVRIALHWCHDVTARMDRIHGRYDYYGHDVNVCARVEGQAQGGQIMVTAETMKAITETDIYDLMIAPDTTAAVFLRDVVLKGVSEPVTLYVLAPTSQLMSGYIPGCLVVDPMCSTQSASRTSAAAFQSIVDVPEISFGIDSSISLDPRRESCIGTSSHNSQLFNVMNGTTTDAIHTSAAAAKYSASLLRMAFRSVPDHTKMVWLTAVAQELSLTLQMSHETDKSTQTRSAQRLEHYKLFEQIQLAVEGDYVTATEGDHSDLFVSRTESKIGSSTIIEN